MPCVWVGPLVGPPACPGPMAKGASRAAENTPSEPPTVRIARIVLTRPFSSLRPSLWCSMWRTSSSLSSGLSSSPCGQTLNRTNLATPLPGGRGCGQHCGQKAYVLAARAGGRGHDPARCLHPYQALSRMATAEISTNWGGRARSTTPKSVLVGRWSPKYSRCSRAMSSKCSRRFFT